jgi:hypothetical protein
MATLDGEGCRAPVLRCRQRHIRNWMRDPVYCQLLQSSGQQLVAAANLLE